MPISVFDLQLLEERCAAIKKRSRLGGTPAPETMAKVEAAPIAVESRLHDAIESDLRRRGWYFIHSRMDRPTTTAIGCPDFIVAAPNGITLWIECKARKGKPSTAQLAAAAMLNKLGHKYAIVRSFGEWEELANAQPFGNHADT
jgi:hypothetical protein